MLTLSPLFGADHELAVLHKVMQMPIPLPSASRPDVPPALDAIVMKALERNPASRYATAAQMARDLDEFVVAAHLHVDDVIQFLRDIEPHLNRPQPSLASLQAGSLADGATEPAAVDTKLDIMGRFRNGRLGRLLFGRARP